jgi:hypothetical protein
MRANEFITEVFQSGKTNWKWLRRTSDEAIANFVVGGRTYQWFARSYFNAGNPQKWEIQFRLIREPSDDENLDLFGFTGTGNSAEVMSTAVDITRAFLQEYGLDKVEEITFNAKQDSRNSRISLYAKMIKRLLPDWDLYQKYTEHNGMEYYLTDRRAYDKPEYKVDEEGMSRRNFLGAVPALAAGAATASLKEPGQPYSDFNKPKLYKDMFVNLPNQVNAESGVVIFNKKIYNPMPFEVFMRYKNSKELSSSYIKQVPANSIENVDEPLMLSTIKGKTGMVYSFYVTPTMLTKFKQQMSADSLASKNPSDVTTLSKQETNPMEKEPPKGIDPSMAKKFNPLKGPQPYTY